MRVNYVKNMEIMTASIVLWEILALAALTTTCGMIHVHPKEPAEIQLTNGGWGEMTREEKRINDS